MASHGLHKVKEENFAFMTCILKVNVRTAGWQKIVMGVLNNTNGVSNFRMNEDGMVEVSGTVDPNLLLNVLAKAGKRAELCWFQFGQCSSNLYLPDRKTYDDYSDNGYYGGSYNEDDRHLHFREHRERPRPRHSYRPFGKVAYDDRGVSDGLGSVSGITAPPHSGEGITCCSLM